MDISLHANGLRVRIGMSLDECELRSARVSKAGFFIKRSLPDIKQTGDIVYWVKNPDLRFFEGAISANPQEFNRDPLAYRDAFRFTTSPINARTDLVFGTSVFLYFNGGHLRLAIAQVILSFTWAQGFTKEFREAAVTSFGDAACSDLANVPALKGSSFHREIHLRCSWNDDHEFLISRLAPKGDNAVIFWGQGKEVRP